MFDENWFSTLFNEYPLLLKFLTTDIQVSSDSTDLKSPCEQSKWKQSMYSALAKKNRSKLLSVELERTVLSIMFLYAIQKKYLDQEGLSFINGYASDLKKDDIEKLWNMGVPINFEDPMCKLFILAIIFGDIAKINNVRDYFSNRHGLVSQDQDIALNYILNLNHQTLATYFNLTVDQIKYLQSHQFPLHLGHAVQAECTAKKFSEAQDFLLQLKEDEREPFIKHAIFKQIVDVAGARAQENIILLNQVILNHYLNLSNALLKLSNPNCDANEIYWQYVANDLVQSKKINFSDKSLCCVSTEREQPILNYGKQCLIYCFILRLRLHQQSDEDKKNSEILLVENIISNLLEKSTDFKKNMAWLERYDEKAPHTFTYGPAIFATLKSAAETDPSLMQGIANSSIEFAIVVGVKIQAIACEQYLASSTKNVDLKQSPLNFNELNALLRREFQLILDIFENKVPLTINPQGAVSVNEDVERNEVLSFSSYFALR